MTRLKDKVAIVTAATRGIGYAIVARLAQEGAIVYMGTPSMEEAVAPVSALRNKGARVHAVYNNAYERDSYQTMVDTVIEQEGRVDILVNNFGTSNPKKDKTITDTDYDTFLHTLDANLSAVYLGVQAVLPPMQSQHSGSIVNISSVSSLRPSNSQIAYGAAKSTINYLTKAIALQCADDGIRCNAVLPAMTDTGAVAQRLSDDFKATFLKHVPLGRMATPDEIAAAVAYLAGDDAAFVTAQLLEVGGGYGVGAPIYGDLRGKSNKR